MAIITTSRLGLTKDDTTENYNVGRVNANTDKLDAAAGSQLCTSVTRPLSPFTGMTGHETDISGNIVYTGSAWKYTSPPSFVNQAGMNAAPGPFFNGLLAATNDGIIWLRQGGIWLSPMSLGVVGGHHITGDDILSGTIGGGSGEVLPDSMHTPTLTLNPGRRYKIHVKYTALGTGADNSYLLRIREGATFGTAGTQIGQYVHVVPTNTSLNVSDEFVAYYETGGVAVNKVFSMTCQMIAGAGTLQFKGGGAGSTNPMGVIVEDVGLAGKMTVVAS